MVTSNLVAGRFDFLWEILSFIDNQIGLNSMVSCQKGPTHHAYAWQIGPLAGYPRILWEVAARKHGPHEGATWNVANYLQGEAGLWSLTRWCHDMGMISTVLNCSGQYQKKHSSSALLVHLWEEPLASSGLVSQMASNAELWCFLWCWPEKAVEQTVDKVMIWDAITLIWCHCNDGVSTCLLSSVTSND